MPNVFNTHQPALLFIIKLLQSNSNRANCLINPLAPIAMQITPCRSLWVAFNSGKGER